MFMTESVKYNVLPIDDRSVERFDARVAGRPDLMNGRTKLTLFSGATGITENAFLNTKNASLTISADVEVAESANGVLICQGGDFGGWTFYLSDGKPTYVYNYLGLEMFTIASPQKIAAGKHNLKFDFAYAGGRGAGGDGTKAAEGKIAKTHANMFGIDESADVGADLNTPVTHTYDGKSKFTGKIIKVTIETLPAKK